VATIEPSQPGTISGALCYPGRKSPPLTLVVQDGTGQTRLELDLGPGQTTYQAELPPGEYVLFAQTVGTEVTGGYSQAGLCGLGNSCLDHSLLPIQLGAGENLSNIDLCDWYEPPGRYPGPADAVWVTTRQRMDIHAGPSLDAPILAKVPPRTTARALARSADQAWLRLDHPAAAEVWIYAPLTKVTGPLEALPVEPAGAIPPSEPGQFRPTSWSSEANEAVVHFKGEMRDQAGQVVNGYSVLLYNGTWSVLSHPTGASRHYPDVAAGAWDLIISNATDAAGWWALTVVSYDCPDFEIGFNAQCKQFTPLSATQIVRVVYPDEAVIKADWLCQSACDQGLYVEPYRP
jgi:hypothetical protein